MNASILSLETTDIVRRMANERIPVNVIARSLNKSAELIRDSLDLLYKCGSIGEVPPPDWPPTARLSDHLPIRSPVPSDDSVMFALRKLMKLTPLEAAFLSVLLKFEEADKTKLHMVIENLRQERQNGPNKMEQTDPKMVDVMICKLRKRLKQLDEKLVIKTMWGRGYYIEEPVRNLLLDHVSRLLSEK